jgi:hypothetical protein
MPAQALHSATAVCLQRSVLDHNNINLQQTSKKQEQEAAPQWCIHVKLLLCMLQAAEQ